MIRDIQQERKVWKTTAQEDSNLFKVAEHSFQEPKPNSP